MSFISIDKYSSPASYVFVITGNGGEETLVIVASPTMAPDGASGLVVVAASAGGGIRVPALLSLPSQMVSAARMPHVVFQRVLGWVGTKKEEFKALSYGQKEDLVFRATKAVNAFCKEFGYEPVSFADFISAT